MARQNYFQNSFASGEVSDLLFAQKNFDRMRNAARKIRNLVCMPYGGVTARPGTLYVARSKTYEPNLRLLPFQFSISEAYILELGAGYARMHTQTGPITQESGVYEVPTPYKAQHLPKVKVIQSNDVLIFTHPDIPPQRLSRYGETSWYWETIPFKFSALLDTNITSTTLTANASTGLITVTASSNVFAATDVGRSIRITSGSVIGDGLITAYQSPTSVQVQALSTIPRGAITTWQLGAWSETTGYPTACCFYEDRLMFAGNRAEPQIIWGSVVGDYYNFTPGANASDALYLPLLSRTYNAIQWLVPYKVLIAGTSSSLWPVSSSNFRDVALSSDTARTVEEIAYGWEPIQPVIMNKSIIAVQLGAKKLREIAYSFEQDGFESSELTLLGEHITGPGIKEMVVQTIPYEVLWCLRLDGVLIGLTFQKDQATIAWHQHEVGGFINSLSAIQYHNESQVWLCVTRSLHGEEVQTIERLSPFFLRHDAFDAIQLDCAQTHNRVVAAHLEIDPLTDVLNTYTLTANEPVFANAQVGDLVQILKADPLGFMRPTPNFLSLTGLASSTTVTAQGQSPERRSLEPGSWALSSKTVQGLSYLEGASVQVLADGADVGIHTITNGQITLERPAFKVTVGFPYEWYLETLDWEVASALGSSEGQFGRISEVNLRLFESGTGYLKVLDGGSKDSVYHFRQTNTAYDTAQGLFTGIQKVTTAGGWARQRHLRIGGQSPLPWTLISLMAKVSVSDT